VYLYSRRYDRVAPRSLIGLSRGTSSLTAFQAQLEKRSVDKLSFGIAGDYYNSSRLGGSSSTFYLNTQAWAQLSYTPSRRYGIVAQYVTSSPKRQDLTSSTTGSVVLGTVGGWWRRRSDGRFSSVAAPSGDARRSAPHGPASDTRAPHGPASDTPAPHGPASLADVRAGGGGPADPSAAGQRIDPVLLATLGVGPAQATLLQLSGNRSEVREQTVDRALQALAASLMS